MFIKLALILLFVLLISVITYIFLKHPKKYNYLYRNNTNLFVNQIEITKRIKYGQTISNQLITEAIYSAKKRADFMTKNLFLDLFLSITISLLINFLLILLIFVIFKFPSNNFELAFLAVFFVVVAIALYFLKWKIYYKKFNITEDDFYNKLEIILSKLNIHTPKQAQNIIASLNEDLKSNEASINTGFQVILTVIILTPLISHLSLLWDLCKMFVKMFTDQNNSAVSAYASLAYILLGLSYLLSLFWEKIRYSNIILLLPTQRRARKIEQVILILERYIYLHSSNQT